MVVTWYFRQVEVVGLYMSILRSKKEVFVTIAVNFQLYRILNMEIRKLR